METETQCATLSCLNGEESTCGILISLGVISDGEWRRRRRRRLWHRAERIYGQIGWMVPFPSGALVKYKCSNLANRSYGQFLLAKTLDHISDLYWKFSSLDGRETRWDVTTLIVTRRRRSAETTDETPPLNPRFSFISSLVESDLSAYAVSLSLPQNKPSRW